jgi:hypothetical protein
MTVLAAIASRGSHLEVLATPAASCYSLTTFVALTARGRLVPLEVVRRPFSHRSRTPRPHDSPRTQVTVAGRVLAPAGCAMDLPVGSQ